MNPTSLKWMRVLAGIEEARQDWALPEFVSDVVEGDEEDDDKKKAKSDNDSDDPTEPESDSAGDAETDSEEKKSKKSETDSEDDSGEKKSKKGMRPWMAKRVVKKNDEPESDDDGEPEEGVLAAIGTLAKAPVAAVTDVLTSKDGDAPAPKRKSKKHEGIQQEVAPILAAAGRVVLQKVAEKGAEKLVNKISAKEETDLDVDIEAYKRLIGDAAEGPHGWSLPEMKTFPLADALKKQPKVK